MYRGFCDGAAPVLCSPTAKQIRYPSGKSFMKDDQDNPVAQQADRSAIRDLLENWVVWRDSGDWDRLAKLWHDGGQMVTTWSTSSHEDFIAASRKVFQEHGAVALHLLGGSSIDIDGIRAVAQSKMQIIMRGALNGVGVISTCTGRFIDAMEKRDGRWGIVLRQPVYELDRLDVVDHSATLDVDPELLASFPAGYRHLGYLQTKMGLKVNPNLPTTTGAEMDALRGRMKKWLAGKPPSCLN